MYGKTIGMAVHNFRQNSSLPQNDFTIALINRWGYQLFPNKGGREIIRDPTWMYTSNWSGKGQINVFGCTSAVKEYTFSKGDDELGKGNDFITHASRTVKYGGKWAFNKVDAVQNKNDQTFKDYSARWNEKW